MVTAGGDNDGEPVGPTQGRVQDDVVVHILSTVVADDAQETNLVVDDEQSGVVSINSFKLVCSS